MGLAQRLHHELLKVAREQDEAVLVRQDDHRALGLALGQVEPGRREAGRGVAGEVGIAGERVHLRRARQQGLGVDALQRRGHQSDGPHHARAAAHPVPHREAGEEARRDRLAVELAAGAGDGDRLGPEPQARGLPAGLGLAQGVARLGGAAGLGHHDDQGAVEAVAEARPRAVEAVRVGVVDEMDAEPVGRAAERVGQQLGTERRAADADDEEVGEGASRTADLARVDPRRERRDVPPGRPDGRGDLGGRGELGRAQPVVADLAVLVGVGDRAGLELGRGAQRLGETAVERGVGPGQPGAAQVQPEGEVEPGRGEQPGAEGLEARVHAPTLPPSCRHASVLRAVSGRWPRRARPRRPGGRTWPARRASPWEPGPSRPRGARRSRPRAPPG